jgi:predicted kinase
LDLTGGPAAGKSSTATELAALRPRAAVIEVDDVRQMVVSGGVAPWKGEEGLRQRHLGVRNACAVAMNILRTDIDVVVTDVLTPESAELYRELLTECLIVRIVVSFEEAQRRAATRRLFLTVDESEALHRADRLPLRG